MTIEEIEQLVSDYRHQVYSNGLLWDSLDEELEDMQTLEDAAYNKLIEAIKQYEAAAFERGYNACDGEKLIAKDAKGNIYELQENDKEQK